MHEDFSRFFEKPTRDHLRGLLKEHVGELDALDFKQEWPAWSKLARHVLAMANSGGGCIVLGVAQRDDNSVEAIGLGEMVDKAEIARGMLPFLPDRLQYHVMDFAFEASEYPAIVGKRFQVLIVEDEPKSTPFVCCADGEGIRKNAIYARKGTSSQEADDYQLQGMINRRLETGHSTSSEIELSRELDELRALYSKSPVPVQYLGLDRDDGFEQFLCQAIADKELMLRHRMGISDEDVESLRHRL